MRLRPTHRRRALRGAALLALAALAAALLALAAAASARATGETTLMVHGLDPIGRASADCRSWQPMVDAFRRWGRRGPSLTLAYYGRDVNCSRSIDGHGSHHTHHGQSGHDRGSHTANASIRHLGHHLAWFVYDRYSRSRRSVDLVGNSMGGLVIRYALHRVEEGAAGFPPRLLVDDVVTLGTPHGGALLAHLCPYALQCREMRPGSRLLAELAHFARDPQALGGTDWTTIGSHGDRIVSERSAVDMDARHRVLYRSRMGIGHGDYRRDTSTSLNADVDYRHRGQSWSRRGDAPHVVRWVYSALTRGSG